MIDEFDESVKIGKCDILQDNHGMFAWRTLQVMKIVIFLEMSKSTSNKFSSFCPKMAERNVSLCMLIAINDTRKAAKNCISRIERRERKSKTSFFRCMIINSRFIAQQNYAKYSNDINLFNLQ